MGKAICLLWAAATLAAQTPARPRFEDFPAAGIEVIEYPPLRLELPAERMFRTRLLAAHEKAPNFAASLRSVIWGCGSNCAAAAFVDLRAGEVHPQPLARGVQGWDRWIIPDGMFEGAGMWGRVDSRLLIIRCGKTWIEKEELLLPATYYFVWKDGKFRRLLTIPADRTALPKAAIRLD
jgi:hypothetical protein